jgi:hypothetical protein
VTWTCCFKTWSFLNRWVKKQLSHLNRAH